jgi:hypothetical protein
MMLTRARRTAGSRLRDVNLVDLFEFFCSMRSKHAGESWRKAGTNHHMHIAFARLLIKCQKRSHIGQIIACADDMNAATNKLFSNLCLGSSWTGQHDDIDIERITQGPSVDACAITKTVGNQFNAITSFVTKHHVVIIGGDKLARETRADCANAQDSDTSHVSPDRVRRALANRQCGAEQHPIRGAERRRRQAPPCRWQSWPVGTFSSWG